MKFIVSHRPSWLFDVVLGNPDFAVHRMAKKYGVRYVIAGHVHQMLRLELEGVTYLSMASSGGHLRASKKYEDGWFFGYTVVDVRGKRRRLSDQGIEAALWPRPHDQAQGLGQCGHNCETGGGCS